MSMRYPGGLIASSPVNAAYPSGVWTQPQTAVYNNVGVWQQDPYFEYTTLLLHGDGTNGAQNNTFLDSSTNAFTITRNGNTTQGAFTPYTANGYWGNYFDGASSLLPASNAAFNFGTGDFTVEAWVYQPASGTQCIYDCRGSDASSGGFFFGTISTNFAIFTGNTIVISTPMQLNTWVHFAIVRSGSTWTLYKNGVSSGTYSSSANLSDANRQIGASTTVTSSSANYLTGYISNLRVVKGTAVYTSAFTPSATPFTAISGTSLLTCQSNRFIDNSSNAFAITVSGSPSVQQFNPFGLPTNWSAPVLGGSGYFDGSGDSLTAPSGACISGTGDFTAECWVFPTVVPGTYNIIGCSDTTNGLTMFGLNANGTIFYGRSLVNVQGTTSNSLSYNTWNHIAISRSSSTLKMFINGVQGFSGTETYSYASGTVRFGTDGGGSALPYTGYISNFRIIQGSAIYTSSFTPPTAPLTAIANTSLLLNLTNAGIFDNAQCNNLETVGNAQVSTSVVKYNTGSMAFDGSGDYLKIAASPNLVFGTGDFTIECWIYVASNQAQYTNIISNWTGSDPAWLLDFSNSSGNIRFNDNSSVYLTSSSALTTGQWNHVAVSRSGTSLKMFFNGTQVASATNSTSFGSASSGVFVGAYYDNTYPLNGYIDDLRITKGYARYIGNFTPPIARFPNQG